MINRELPSATLVIGRSSSQCNNCGNGADPHAKSHDELMGYGIRGPGCGITWTHVATMYVGMDDVVAKLRPDLILIPIDKQLERMKKNA